MRTEEKTRLGRLAGTEEGGGGLQLPSLFQAILNDLLDNGPADDTRLTEITEQTLGGQSARMRETWGSWRALAADALAQMEYVGVIKRDADYWVTGEQFRTHVFLEIIPQWNGQPPDGTIILPVQERQERDAATHALRSYAEVDAQVVSRGFRGVTQARLNLIRESMELLGDLRQYFPVLVDNDGHVIDGRHRLAIDPNWPVSGNKVKDDLRVAVALAANQTNSWTGKDWDRLRKQAELTHTPTRAGRVLARLALLEDATRSNRDIAETVAVGYMLVAEVRAKLTESGSIHHYEFSGGRRSGVIGQGARTGKHSASCWCGEGTAAPQVQTSQPKKTAQTTRKWDAPELLDATREAILAGQPVTPVAKRFGVAGTTADRSAIFAQGFIQGQLSVSKSQLKPQPETEEAEPPQSRDLPTAQPDNPQVVPTEPASNCQHLYICQRCGQVQLES